MIQCLWCLIVCCSMEIQTTTTTSIECSDTFANNTDFCLERKYSRPLVIQTPLVSENLDKWIVWIIEAHTFIYRAPLKCSNKMHPYTWNTLIEQSFSIPDKWGLDNRGSTVSVWIWLSASFWCYPYLISYQYTTIADKEP